MIDLEIKKTINELYEFLNPKVVEKVKSHLFSLYRQIEDLSSSRDNWKRKYKEVKENAKTKRKN